MPGASVAGFVYVLLIVVAATAGAATWADPYGLVPAPDDGGAGGQTRPAPGNPYPTVVRAVPLPKAQWPPELPAARQVKHRPRLERDARPAYPSRRWICRALPPATSKHSPGVRILPGRMAKAKRVPEAALGPHRRSLP